jgi:hypothetical protein
MGVDSYTILQIRLPAADLFEGFFSVGLVDLFVAIETISRIP